MSTIFEDVAKVPHDSFVYKPCTGENTKAVQNAINKYAPDCHFEEVLLFYDYTILGNGSKGILLTWDKIYNSSMRGTVIRFDDIVRLRILPNDNYRLEITVTGGKVIMFNTFGKAEYCMPVLKLVMQHKQERIAPKPVESTAAIPQTAPQPKAAADHKAVLPSLYKQVDALPHEAFVFSPCHAENKKAVQTALDKYAKGCSMADVVLFYDYTIIGNGKKGILLTWDGIYSSAMSGMIRFDDITRLRKFPNDDYALEITTTGMGVSKFNTFGKNEYCLNVLQLVMKARVSDAPLKEPVKATQRQVAGQSMVPDLAADVAKLHNVGHAAAFVPRGKENADAIQTAISTFAKECNREDIALFYDCSTFQNGKKGIILTWDGFYADGLSNKEKYLRYDDILELHGLSSDLTTTIYIKNKKERSDIKLETQIYGDYFIDALKQVNRYRAKLMLKFPKLFLAPKPEVPDIPGPFGDLVREITAMANERIWYRPVTDQNKKAVLDSIKAYGGSCHLEDVLLIYDDDLYESTKQGFLLAKDRFYTKDVLGGIRYDDIIRILPVKDNVLKAEATLTNGKVVQFYTYHRAEQFIQVLKAVMRYAASQKAVQPMAQTTAQPAAQTTAQPAAQTTAQPAAKPTVQPAAKPTVQSTTQPPVVSQERIKETFDQIRAMRAAKAGTNQQTAAVTQPAQTQPEKQTVQQAAPQPVQTEGKAPLVTQPQKKASKPAEPVKQEVAAPPAAKQAEATQVPPIGETPIPPAPEPQPYEPVFEPVFATRPKPKTEDMAVVTRKAKPKPKQGDVDAK